MKVLLKVISQNSRHYKQEGQQGRLILESLGDPPKLLAKL